LDVEVPQDFREKKNRTYLIWEFGKPSDVVVEIISNKEGNELGSKLRDYARIGVTYYIIFDPLNQLGEKVLRVHGLREGQYVELDEPWLEQIGLGLTLWNGEFEGITGVWLRWCDRQGTVLLTGAERAKIAEAKAEKFAERLRELGVNPDELQGIDSHNNGEGGIRTPVRLP
jgi:Putative restriction endonuclease